MNRMQIRIDKPGILSTVQDMGRWDYLSQGVPLAGAMDSLSARIANLALGNAPEAAVIEFTFGGAAFSAMSELLIAHAGDGAVLKAGDQLLPADRPVFIPRGTKIRLVADSAGCRTYLAVAGGWDVPETLGSKSTYITAALGGYEGRALGAGDVLRAHNDISGVAVKLHRHLGGQAIRYPTWSIARRLLLPADRKTIRVVPGREFAWFDGQSLVDFLSASFKITPKSNRMGYCLDGPPIHKLLECELLSTAVVPGTIQVTGAGSLVLLMADCQTTGGYPRIAQVAAVDMPLCAQLKAGDEIYFREISRADAEKLYLHRANQLNRLAIALMINALTTF